MLFYSMVKAGIKIIRGGVQKIVTRKLSWVSIIQQRFPLYNSGEISTIAAEVSTLQWRFPLHMTMGGFHLTIEVSTIQFPLKVSIIQ